MISRRGFLKASLHVGLGLGAAGLAAFEYATRVEPFWLSLEQAVVPLQGLDPALAGFRVACLSDFHLRPGDATDLAGQAVARTNRLAVDLICLLGDYVLGSADAIEDLAPVLGGLHARHGVVGVLGNHDLWTDAQRVRARLEGVGVRVLVNARITLEVGQRVVCVAGLDDGWSGSPDLAAALQGAPQGAPTILLMHEPDFADAFSAEGRVSLQLSGHSHGGQVRLPGVGAPVLPWLGQKYDQGLYRVKGMWLYTARGIGMIDPQLRFNCRPEIAEITLARESEPLASTSDAMALT